MEFSTQTTASLHQIKTSALAVGVYADGVLGPAADTIDRASNGAIRAVTKAEFRGRAGATLVLRNLAGVSAQRVVLVGLGKQEEYNARAHASAEQAFAAYCVSAQLAEGVSTLVSLPVENAGVRDRARAAAIAAGQATYHYDATFGKPDRDARPKLKKITQVVERADTAQTQLGLREGAAIANGMELARTLGNLPGNVCTPSYLGDTARKLARDFKSLIKVEVLDRKQVEALGMEVVGLVAACENLPSGKANKPGDVVTSMSGQTIEILNTDAEGRLILCDALTYAERFKPSAVIDIATLTGACVVALGSVNTGLFSKDDALAEALLAAGRQAQDTAWRMPLDDAYQEQLKSNFADIANIGGPQAGAVTAACFLSRFTKAYPWAHLDIAGTAWRGGKDKGATGRPVPLLMQYLLNRNA